MMTKSHYRLRVNGRDIVVKSEYGVSIRTEERHLPQAASAVDLLLNLTKDDWLGYVQFLVRPQHAGRVVHVVAEAEIVPRPEFIFLFAFRIRSTSFATPPTSPLSPRGGHPLKKSTKFPLLRSKR